MNSLLIEVPAMCMRRGWPVHVVWATIGLLSGGDPLFGARTWDPHGDAGSRVGIVAMPEDAARALGVERDVVGEASHPELVARGVVRPGTSWASLRVLRMSAVEQVYLAESMWRRHTPSDGYRRPGDWLLAALGVSPLATDAVRLHERGSTLLVAPWPLRRSLSVDDVHSLAAAASEVAYKTLVSGSKR